LLVFILRSNESSGIDCIHLDDRYNQFFLFLRVALAAFFAAPDAMPESMPLSETGPKPAPPANPVDTGIGPAPPAEQAPTPIGCLFFKELASLSGNSSNSLMPSPRLPFSNSAAAERRNYNGEIESVKCFLMKR
jgi:hypothetical protein